MREIETPDDLAAWLAETDREPAAVQALDLQPFSDVFCNQAFPGSLFLGCTLTDAEAGHLVNTGATVLKNSEKFSFSSHRRALYTPDELFPDFDLDDPNAHTTTLDNQIYEEYLAHGSYQPDSIEVTLAQRLHDHSITDAMEEFLEGQRVVAIMGGHGMERGDPMYAAVARIARTLTPKGYLMLSGGGPGAMEGTHLGAYLANFDDDALLDRALAILSQRPAGAEPGKEYADPDWLHRAMRTRAEIPLPQEVRYHSLGIPTWHYGHEPPAAFATLIAKYFANSVREEGLLAVANHGVVFSPGSAGTTQEIFQDAAQNHYKSYGAPAPMVFLGREHWTKTRPVWPLLRHVSEGHDYGALLCLTDDEEAVVEQILAYVPAQ